MKKGIIGKFVPSIVVSLLFAFTYCIFVPYVTYQSNINEFSFTGEALIVAMLPSFAIVFAVSLLLLTLASMFIFKKSLYKIPRINGFVSPLHIVFIAIVFCTWVEGFILNRGLASLTGDSNLYTSTPRLLVDSLVWLGVLVVCVVFWKHLAKIVIFATVCLFVVMGAGILDTMLNSDGRIVPSFSRSEVIDRVQFHENNNVLVLVPDAMSTSLIHSYVDENPEKKEVFDGFVLFENNMESGTSTQWALPSLLRGDLYTGGSVTEYREGIFQKKTSLPVYFKNLGYNVYVSSTLPMFNNILELDQASQSNGTGSMKMTPTLYGQMYIRFAPYAVKNPISNNVGFSTSVESGQYLSTGNFEGLPAATEPSADAQIYMALMNAITKKNSQNPVFQFHHLVGVHKPYSIDCEGNELPETESHSLTGLYGQNIWTLNKITELLQCMKDNGIYDSSTIVIVGDHEDWMYSEERPDPYAQHPALLIKSPNQHGELVRSSAPTSNMYMANIVSAIHAENEKLEDVTSDLPATRSFYNEWDSLIHTYEGISVLELVATETTFVEQVFLPSVLEEGQKYSLATLVEGSQHAYPLALENCDFTNGWGIKLLETSGNFSFYAKEKALYDVTLVVETAVPGGGHSEYPPYQFILRDTNTGNESVFEMKEVYETIRLEGVSASKNKTLSMEFSIPSFSNEHSYFVNSITIETSDR